jgi:hypothetical protein
VRGLPAFNTHQPARALRHRPSSHGEGLSSSPGPAPPAERAGPAVRPPLHEPTAVRHRSAIPAVGG